MNGSTLCPEYPGVERRRHRVLPYSGEERRSSMSNSRTLNDEAVLLRRATNGDPEAFARLFDRFVDKVYKYVYFNIGDRSIAERLTARVFVRTWQRLQQGARVPPSLVSWLNQIADDVIAEHRQVEIATEWRGKAGRGESTLFVENEHLAALKQLSDEQRQVLVLRFLVGYTTEQVAQILGTPPSAIQSIQHRGLGRLGSILSKGTEK